MKGRFIGIDLGKRSFMSAFMDERGVLDKVKQFNTGISERKRFCKELSAEDCIGIEACALAFVIAREIKKESGASGSNGSYGLG